MSDGIISLICLAAITVRAPNGIFEQNISKIIKSYDEKMYLRILMKRLET